MSQLNYIKSSFRLDKGQKSNLRNIKNKLHLEEELYIAKGQYILDIMYLLLSSDSYCKCLYQKLLSKCKMNIKSQFQCS